MKPTHREEAVYAAVRMGLLEIRADGSVWRVKYRRKSRWDGTITICPSRAPARVDASCGAGYRSVKVMMDGRQVTCLAHRLVWLHTHGPIPSDLQINHKNGDKADNRPINLEICSHQENAKHAHAIGLANQRGTKNNNSHLSPMDVESIRTAYASKRTTQAALARKHGVTPQAISKIVRGDRMRYESGPMTRLSRS